MTVDGNIYNAKSYIKRFRFIEEFICGYSIDKNKAFQVINRYIQINKEEIKDPNDPLYKLSKGWWFMQDKEANELLLQVNNTLSNNPEIYSITSYARIIALNITFKRINIIENDINNLGSSPD
jgi:hypothetical protein